MGGREGLVAGPVLEWRSGGGEIGPVRGAEAGREEEEESGLAREEASPKLLGDLASRPSSGGHGRIGRRGEGSQKRHRIGHAALHTLPGGARPLDGTSVGTVNIVVGANKKNGGKIGRRS